MDAKTRTYVFSALAGIPIVIALIWMAVGFYVDQLWIIIILIAIAAVLGHQAKKADNEWREERDQAFLEARKAKGPAD